MYEQLHNMFDPDTNLVLYSNPKFDSKYQQMEFSNFRA
jgi:hypothetical protein